MSYSKFTLVCVYYSVTVCYCILCIHLCDLYTYHRAVSRFTPDENHADTDVMHVDLRPTYIAQFTVVYCITPK